MPTIREDAEERFEAPPRFDFESASASACASAPAPASAPARPARQVSRRDRKEAEEIARMGATLLYDASPLIKWRLMR
jgi:hypothetical protein